MTEQLPPPGWYPAPHANNEMRYWDGHQWTEHLPVAPAAEATVADPATATGPERNPSRKAWIIGGSIAAGVLAIGGVGSALGLGGTADVGSEARPATTAEATAESTAEEVVVPETTWVVVPDVVGMTVADAINTMTTAGLEAPAVTTFADPSATVIATDPVAGYEVEAGRSVTFTVEEKPKLTIGQQNAIEQAKSYLAYSGFSRTGLIDQLEFEGYTTEDATFGADNAGADWNAEAAEKAQQYMDLTSFSRQGLYDQLAFEGFTPEQIEFGLAAVGY